MAERKKNQSARKLKQKQCEAENPGNTQLVGELQWKKKQLKFQVKGPLSERHKIPNIILRRSVSESDGWCLKDKKKLVLSFILE